MNPSCFRFTLDIHNMASQLTLAVKRGDTNRKLIIGFMENGLPYQIDEGCSAKVLGVIPNGNETKTVEIACEVNIADNVVECNLNANATEISGELECEVRLSKTVDNETNQITSPRFTIIVDETITSESGIVDAYQDKTVTPTKNTQILTADGQYKALGTVTVKPIPNEYIIPSGKKTISENGDNIDVKAYEKVAVNVPTSATPVLQEKTVTPSESQQIITPDGGYDALSQVTVLGDANLLAENIKKGVTIFGVTGTYEASGGGGSEITNFETAYNQGYNFNGTTITFTNATYSNGGYSFKIAFANGTYISGSAGGGMGFSIYDPYSSSSTEIMQSYWTGDVEYTFRDGSENIGSDCSITGFYRDSNMGENWSEVSASEFCSDLTITFTIGGSGSADAPTNLLDAYNNSYDFNGKTLTISSDFSYSMGYNYLVEFSDSFYLFFQTSSNIVKWIDESSGTYGSITPNMSPTMTFPSRQTNAQHVYSNAYMMGDNYISDKGTETTFEEFASNVSSFTFTIS